MFSFNLYVYNLYVSIFYQPEVVGPSSGPDKTWIC